MVSAQRQFLVKVSGLDGFMSTKSGGNIASDTTKHYNGGIIEPEVLAGPPNIDDITVSRGFNATRDEEILSFLRQNVGRWVTTVSVTPTDRDLVAQGKPVVYPDALLTGFTELEVDSASGDVSTYQLTFTVSSVR